MWGDRFLVLTALCALAACSSPVGADRTLELQEDYVLLARPAGSGRPIKNGLLQLIRVTNTSDGKVDQISIHCRLLDEVGHELASDEMAVPEIASGAVSEVTFRAIVYPPWEGITGKTRTICDAIAPGRPVKKS